MTEQAVDGSGLLLGEWWTKRVPLSQGEVPLRVWEASHLGFFQGWGVLYLTSHRLVWVSAWFFLLGTRWLQIQLDEIIGCTAKWSFWRLTIGRALVVDTRLGRSRWFMPVGRRVSATIVASEITAILRERGFLHD